MARINLMDSRTTNFLELIGNGKVYRVPPYQRDYSWKEEHWEDLWSDLLALREHSDDRHYMGALVVEGKSDREFLIIDGQQRLATLSILALAVIARLTEMAENGEDAGSNRERAAGLRNRFIGEKDPASLIETSKLFLNVSDDAFYQDYLVQLRSPHNPRGLIKSNRQLWDCFQYYQKRLNEIPELKVNGEAIAYLLTETVARQLMFILITVDDEINAYTVFETLNARGEELSATDLLKNFLFSRIKVSTDLEALQRRWRAIIATAGQERFPELLRYHLACEHPQIRSSRLFKLVRDQVRSPSDVFALIEALERRVELFTALSDVHHAYWIDNTDCKPFIHELILFRVRQMTPLLFAAWERFSSEDFARTLRLISVLSFRYSVVSDLNANPLEHVYHEAARAVFEGRVATPSQVFQKVRQVYIEDQTFKQNFARLAIDTRGPRKKLVKYILAVLEGDASGRACNPDTDTGSIEHILPENPSDVWESQVPQEYWDSVVYRLGNLTLLEPSANRQAGNREYEEKLPFYKASSYALTRNIVDQAPDEWTMALLEDRQNRLAMRAAHLWRVDN